MTILGIVRKTYDAGSYGGRVSRACTCRVLSLALCLELKVLMFHWCQGTLLQSIGFVCCQVGNHAYSYYSFLLSNEDHSGVWLEKSCAVPGFAQKPAFSSQTMSSCSGRYNLEAIQQPSFSVLTCPTLRGNAELCAKKLGDFLLKFRSGAL